MGSRRDAASVIFNLPGYRVIEAVDMPLGGRRVKVQPVDLDQGCPECGVVSSRVHAWVMQRVRDIPHTGWVEVVVRKPRLVCAEPACARRTFIAATDQLPLRARCTTRLRTALLAAVIDSGRAVAEVAADFGVAWWTVQATINAAAVLLPNIDELYVRRLGIDEHRYRRVRWFRDETRWLAAGWSRGCQPSSTPTAVRCWASSMAATLPPSRLGWPSAARPGGTASRSSRSTRRPRSKRPSASSYPTPWSASTGSIWCS